MKNQPAINHVEGTASEYDNLTIDVAAGQGAELVFWSLWQKRENLIQDAAVTLAHGDSDAYLLEQERIEHLGEMITDLFMDVNSCAERLSREKYDPSIVMMRERIKAESFGERKTELLAN